MSTKKRPKKQYRPKPVRITLGLITSNSKPYTECPEHLRTKILISDALKNLIEDKGGRRDFVTLYLVANMYSAIVCHCEEGYDKVAMRKEIDLIVANFNKEDGIFKRYLKDPNVILTQEEKNWVSDMIYYHYDILELATYAEVKLAYERVFDKNPVPELREVGLYI